MNPSIDCVLIKNVSLDSLVKDLEGIDSMEALHAAGDDISVTGPAKIRHIKQVRIRTDGGLRDANHFVEALYNFKLALSVTDRLDKYAVLEHTFRALADRDHGFVDKLREKGWV